MKTATFVTIVTLVKIVTYNCDGLKIWITVHIKQEAILMEMPPPPPTQTLPQTLTQA